MPNFKESFVCGPEHKREFIFKVALNGKDYQPTVPNQIKKTAKANAAQFALQELGLLPKDPNNPLWFDSKIHTAELKVSILGFASLWIDYMLFPTDFGAI